MGCKAGQRYKRSTLQQLSALGGNLTLHLHLSPPKNTSPLSLAKKKIHVASHLKEELTDLLYKFDRNFLSP